MNASINKKRNLVVPHVDTSHLLMSHSESRDSLLDVPLMTKNLERTPSKNTLMGDKSPALPPQSS